MKSFWQVPGWAECARIVEGYNMFETGTQGLTVGRRFTRAGEDPYASIEWTRRDSRIANPAVSATATPP